MSELVYILRSTTSFGVSSTHERFFTSPYNAMAKAARIMDETNARNVKYTLDFFARDMDDTPCDHVAIMQHSMSMLQEVNRNAKSHGFILVQEGVCIYSVLHDFEEIGRVCIVFLPPLPEMDVNPFSSQSDDDMGSVFFNVLEGDRENEKLKEFRILIETLQV